MCVPWQSPSGGERRALVSSAGPPGGAVEVDLYEGRGSGQADARRRGRSHPAAAAELLHGASLPRFTRFITLPISPGLAFCEE